MIIKRPHILKYNLPGTDSTQNENGDWISGTTGGNVEISCRYEPNGSGKTIPSNDGNQVVYSGIVYLDKGAIPVIFGTPVEVFYSGRSIFNGNAISFSNGQKNSRLWV
jgi:hypothetical protein